MDDNYSENNQDVGSETKQVGITFTIDKNTNKIVSAV